MQAGMSFSANRVMRRSLGIVLRNLVPFAVLALILFTPVFVVSLIAGPGVINNVWQPAEGDAASPIVGSQFVVGMLAFLALYVLAGAVAHATKASLDGGRVGAVAAVRDGFQGLLPAADVAFVTGVLVGIGFVLLVVPGLVLACILFVAVPAALAEGLPVARAFGRSAALTRGHRLQLLLVVLATLIPMMAAGFFLPTLFAPLGRTLSILIAAHVQVVFALLGAVAMSVAYHDLRRAQAS